MAAIRKSKGRVELLARGNRGACCRYLTTTGHMTTSTSTVRAKVMPLVTLVMELQNMLFKLKVILFQFRYDGILLMHTL